MSPILPEKSANFLNPTLMAKERKYASVAIDDILSTGRFSGYASVFNEIDTGNDIVAKGAFSKSLLKRGPEKIRMLFQHNPNEPVGIWEDIHENEKGLHVVGVLSNKTRRGKELINLTCQGAVDGLSIGFKTIRSKKNRSSNVRTILEADLWEISIVTFPMHESARIDMKERKELPTTREFERWLKRDVGLSRREAHTVIAKGFSHLSGKRDAATQTHACLANSIRQATQIMAAKTACQRKI